MISRRVETNHRGSALSWDSACCWCSKPFGYRERYAVHTHKTAMMAAPAYYYYHLGCEESAVGDTPESVEMVINLFSERG